ncbi:AAA-ATPase [Rhodococcus phage Whack]|uniref:AAA-ATPase n=1 Tax=Rhodococcus phage Whack TaxID=2591132 RepID=A0A515MKJ6_9CAUD|nr:AAA-ATPase [Rhodococcus phage Whack]QDM57140.1 AAA-ATPase [Rhodococcus phage Whack]
MTTLEVQMPWHSAALGMIELSESSAISVPRQSGRTRVGLDASLRASVRGERVLYLTDGWEQSKDALARFTHPLKLNDPHVLARVRKAHGACEVELTNGGLVHFAPYGSRGIRGRFDLTVCDDYRGHSIDDVLVNTDRILYAGLGSMPSGVPTFRIGANRDDDVDDEDVWERVHPGVGITTTVAILRRLHQSLTRERFAVEILNIEP